MALDRACRTFSLKEESRCTSIYNASFTGYASNEVAGPQIEETIGRSDSVIIT